MLDIIWVEYIKKKKQIKIEKVTNLESSFPEDQSTTPSLFFCSVLCLPNPTSQSTASPQTGQLSRSYSFPKGFHYHH